MGGRRAPPELRLRHPQNGTSKYKLEPAGTERNQTTEAKAGSTGGRWEGGGDPEASRAFRDENGTGEKLWEPRWIKCGLWWAVEASGLEGEFPLAEVEGRASPGVSESVRIQPLVPRPAALIWEPPDVIGSGFQPPFPCTGQGLGECGLSADPATILMHFPPFCGPTRESAFISASVCATS